jgi:hypothetical protein
MFAADLVTGFQQPVLTALFKPISGPSRVQVAPNVALNRIPKRQRNQPNLVSVDGCGAGRAFPRGAFIPDQKKKCAAFAVK